MLTHVRWMIVVIILLLIIAGLCALLLMKPAPTDTEASAVQQTESSNTTSQTPPETSSSTSAVIIAEPQQGATVGPSFTVSGTAPNSWFFEAVFPVQVRDTDDNVVGSGQARAQSDWTVPGTIPFTATISIGGYRGPAELILMKDNPSGMPENDDAVTLPITIGN